MTVANDPSLNKSPAVTVSKPRPYRFGFVLTTAAGNMTRYLNLRKYADRDPEVECVWAPVSHYMEPNPFERLPAGARTRLIVMLQSRPVSRRMAEMDAVMYHVFEPSVLAIVRGYLRRKPLLVWSADNPPIADPNKHPYYGGEHDRTRWRERLRFRFDMWMMRRFRLFFPFSQWAANIMIEDCGLPADRIHAINVGLDLELWPYVPKPADTPTTRPQILFVGGNFVRKGGDLVLDAYRKHFADRADLHLVTTEPPADLPPGVKVYTDFKPNDTRLRQLYADTDLFVMPTRGDLSPWVILEAMATGRPVISTKVGGIPDMVTQGENGFLIANGDADALSQHMETLLANPELCRKMGAAGRAKIEREFNAEVCVPRILGHMKAATDEARARQSRSARQGSAA